MLGCLLWYRMPADWCGRLRSVLKLSAKVSCLSIQRKLLSLADTTPPIRPLGNLVFSLWEPYLSTELVLWE